MLRTPKILLLIESSRASGRAILKGIANFAHDHGPWSFYWEPGGFERVKPMLKLIAPDGVILRDVDQLRQVRAFGIPTVVVGHRRREIPGLINVVTDSPKIGRMAAAHLLQCGFKHFACVSYRRTPWADARARFFAEELQAAGLAVRHYRTPPPAQINWVKERLAIAKWLKSLPRPVGVLAGNDDIGVQVMEACKLAALAVPDAVGVVGVDNDEVVCGLADPAMSSISLNFERAGYECAGALDHLLRQQGGGPRPILVRATHVVARRSTEVVAVQDAEVARALRFIREQGRRPLGVDEVARAAGLSRRVLERRFRREFNSSVQAEIRRVRTDQIARLLVETPLSVSAIAETLGFPDVHHFARYFRSGKKISPLAYRRQNGARPGSPA